MEVSARDGELRPRCAEFRCESLSQRVTQRNLTELGVARIVDQITDIRAAADSTDNRRREFLRVVILPAFDEQVAAHAAISIELLVAALEVNQRVKAESRE